MFQKEVLGHAPVLNAPEIMTEPCDAKGSLQKEEE